jgi:hypothetical protein
MRALIASVAAIGLVATPVLAATTTGKMKTTTAKVTPTSAKAVGHATVKKRMTRSHAMSAKAVQKTAQSAKKTG